MSAGPGPQPPVERDAPSGALIKGVAIILVFLVAGFFLVRSLGTTPSSATSATTAPPAPATTPSTAPPPTTTPTKNPSDVKLLLVNATSTVGVTKPVLDAIKPACYAHTNPAVYDAAKKDNPAKSRLYWIPTYEAEAKKLAKDLGLTDQDVAQMPTENPIARGAPAANIYVMVGKDWAEKPPTKLAAAENCQTSGSTTTTKAGSSSGSTSTTKAGSTTTKAGSSTTKAGATTTTKKD